MLSPCSELLKQHIDAFFGLSLLVEASSIGFADDVVVIIVIKYIKVSQIVYVAYTVFKIVLKKLFKSTFIKFKKS